MKRSDRLNMEIAYITARPAFQLSDLMARFNISKRTATRDIRALEDLGVALYADSGRGGSYHVMSRGPVLPVNLSEDEVSALLFAMRAADLVPDNPYSELLPVIRERLLASLPANRRERQKLLWALVRCDESPAVRKLPFLKDLAEACLSLHVVKITSPEFPSGPKNLELYEITCRDSLWTYEGIDTADGAWCRNRADRITAFRDTGKAGPKSREELQALHDRAGKICGSDTASFPTAH